MEPWQEKILTEIFHKDFLEDKEIIGRAFQEVCKPIEGKGNEQHKCIYNGVIEDKEDEFYCMFELELQIYSYQLTVFNDYLRLLVGKKTQYYLENKLIDEDTLLQGAKEKYEENNNFAVVIRADENVDYGKIMALLDKFKAVGITKFGLATETMVDEHK